MIKKTLSWSKNHWKYIALFVLAFLWGANTGNTKYETVYRDTPPVEVVREVPSADSTQRADAVRENMKALRDVDNEFFTVSAELADVCSKAVISASDGDYVSLDNHAFRLNAIADVVTDDLTPKRNEILSREGLEN